MVDVGLLYNSGDNVAFLSCNLIKMHPVIIEGSGISGLIVAVIGDFWPLQFFDDPSHVKVHACVSAEEIPADDLQACFPLGSHFLAVSADVFSSFLWEE